MPRDSSAIALRCHPSRPSTVIDAVQARVDHTAKGGLIIHYQLSGNLDRVRIPPRHSPGPAQDLWQQTCCEAFISRRGDRAYREFNFSPSGQWAIISFDGYRRPRSGEAASPPPRLQVRRSPGLLRLTALLAPQHLSAADDDVLEIGLAVVIEAADGTLSYWALHHADGKPDFHRRESFMLALAAAPEPRAKRQAAR